MEYVITIFVLYSFLVPDPGVGARRALTEKSINVKLLRINEGNTWGLTWTGRFRCLSSPSFHQSSETWSLWIRV